MSDIQVGDKVRIILEDEVIHVSNTGRTLHLKNKPDEDLWFDLDEDNIKVEVVEKAKPPVVTFKPGDVVRHLSGSLYLVTDEGVASLATGKCYDSPSWREKYLNSEFYTKVELHEAPL